MRDIETLRAAIDRIDRKIQGLFEERMNAVDEVAAIKKAGGVPVADPAREEELLDSLAGRASTPQLGEEIVCLYREMLSLSRARQERDRAQAAAEDTAGFFREQ